MKNCFKVLLLLAFALSAGSVLFGGSLFDNSVDNKHLSQGYDEPMPDPSATVDMQMNVGDPVDSSAPAFDEILNDVKTAKENYDKRRTNSGTGDTGGVNINNTDLTAGQQAPCNTTSTQAAPTTTGQ